ncbi:MULTISPECIES: hypothetical protein [Burkholderia cepacia complex]|uniref:Uncharacterized protein n=1 Tax=Burkholderia ubonensis TaxID=101571 RepID=A0A1B4LI34_9BURK|nr:MULTISPECIES: hypothetical protein [Burkholderia cepacia complex]AOJ16984.1 hypothetical protein WJ02_25195 [Burkholderia vietnamiensis]AOJ76775.1 hypothetical protein WJ35_17030 [Burkholderia ubonensis]AOK13867.1 hypothetical protein WK31_26490 [Burkholderia vietnamiensis]
MAARPPVDRGAVLRATASCVRFGDAVSVARNVDFPLMQVNGVPVEARKTGRSASVTAIASRRARTHAAEPHITGEWRAAAWCRRALSGDPAQAVGNCRHGRPTSDSKLRPR